MYVSDGATLILSWDLVFVWTDLFATLRVAVLDMWLVFLLGLGFLAWSWFSFLALVLWGGIVWRFYAFLLKRESDGAFERGFPCVVILFAVHL